MYYILHVILYILPFFKLLYCTCLGFALKCIEMQLLAQWLSQSQPVGRPHGPCMELSSWRR